MCVKTRRACCYCCTYIYISISICKCVYLHVCIYIHIFIYMCIYIHTYIHTAASAGTNTYKVSELLYLQHGMTIAANFENFCASSPCRKAIEGVVWRLKTRQDAFRYTLDVSRNLTTPCSRARRHTNSRKSGSFIVILCCESSNSRTL